MKVFKEVSLADSLTILNALFGFSAIIYTVLHGIRTEIFALFYFSTFADGLDGFIAKKTEKSPFGKELDSLADSISFGVFPAVLLVVFNSNLFPFASLLVAFSILRLARFNVLSFTDFYGLPTLVTALIVTSLIRIEMDYYILASVTSLLSILMVSDVVYPRVGDAMTFGIIGAVLVSSIFFVEMCYVILTLTGIYVVYPLVREVMWKWREKRLRRQLLRQE